MKYYARNAAIGRWSRLVPWSTLTALVAVAFLLGSCCVTHHHYHTHTHKYDKQEPKKQDPGYPYKRVRFKNAGSRPVKPGMVTEYSHKADGSSGWVQHNNTWQMIPPGHEDMRSNPLPTSACKCSFRMIFQLEGSAATIQIVAARPALMTDGDDVEECFVTLYDDPTNPHGCRAVVQFMSYQKGCVPPDMGPTSSWDVSCNSYP